jgi:hypothetical protein
MFTELLEERLEELILADPDEAKCALEASMESLPDPYQIAQMCSANEWACQLMMCDQMQIRLNRINYKQGQILMMATEELPSLSMIIEAL